MIDFVEQSVEFNNSRMLDIVQNGDLVLKHAGLGLKVLEASLVNHFDRHRLIVALAHSAVHLAELARAKQLLRIDCVLFVQTLSKISIQFKHTII
mgnify:CR=1 FL=1